MKPTITLLLLLLLTTSLSAENFAITGGTLSGSKSVCAGNNSGTLNLTGNTAPVVRWEYSLSGGEPWATINSTLDHLDFENLISTTWYRAVVSDGTETVYSGLGKITVSNQPQGGTIFGESQKCSTDNGTLKLENFSGNIVRWEYSTTSGIWNQITNTTDELSYTNIIYNTDYRAIIQTDGCPETQSDVFPITVNSATVGGTLNGSTTVCETSNSTTLNLSGQTGNVTHWETSQTGNAPWSVISGSENQTSLAFDNQNASAFYRIVVQNTACNIEYSSIANILVNEETESGYLIGAKEVCSDYNSGELGLVNHLGDIQQWEYSENNGSNWTAVTNSENLTQIDFTDITETRLYRTLIKNGVCPVKYTENIKITVNPLPEIIFSADNVCENVNAAFNNTTTVSSGYVDSYIWEFGDGDKTGSKNPQHNYPESGIYSVKLTAKSDKGCIDSLRKQLTIYPKPTPDFQTTDVCDSETALFTNQSKILSGTMNYEWTFNDLSSTSQDENPSYTFSGNGTFNVKLLAVSDKNCKDSVTKGINIFPLAAPDFSFDEVCKGEAVQFTNNSSISEGNFSSLWDFGDSQNSNNFNPKHLYANAGIYTVKLKVTSSQNCEQEITKQVSVNPIPNTAFSLEDACEKDLVNFTNSSNISSGNLTFSWNLGDGTFSEQETPVYSYRNPGNYLITLQAVSDKNCKKSVSKNLNIFPLPKAAFSVENVCFFDSARFQNLSTISSGSLNYFWSFDDNSTSAKANPTHFYTEDKTYKAKLKVVSENACADSVYTFVEVYPKPVADFVAPAVCAGKAVEFLNTSTIKKGKIINFLWDFGDGSNSLQENPSKLYFNPEEYEISLQVYSEFGCSDTIQKSFSPTSNPVADFNVENVCLKNTISPQNTTSNYENLQFEWNFGDGNTSNSVEPEHLYSLPEIYTITLKAISPAGCLDSLRRNVIIYPLPNTNTGNDTVISRGYPLTLSAKGGDEFIWLPTTGLDDPFSENPIAKLNESITYQLQSKNEFGCVNYDSVKIEVLNDYKLEATNVVTPNNDGYNDYWTIYNVETFTDCNLNIYDRWGRLVYFKQNYQNNWDGRNMNNDILPDGTYYYVIEFDSSDKTYKGAITVLRGGD